MVGEEKAEGDGVVAHCIAANGYLDGEVHGLFEP